MNEDTWVEGAEKALQTGGGTVTNTSYAAAATATIAIADTAGFTHLAFESEFTFGTAADVGGTVDLYARALNFDGTNDAEVPQTNFPHEFIGSIPVRDTTALQRFRTRPLRNPYPTGDIEIYIRNLGGQTINSWALRVTPMTHAPG